ncbi:myotrophin, putative [Ixodes scapularis]|uniref:Myotrophin, putative n=1 Tax=Ixodes scapularis TaxID=6945 RepID=B7PMU1_IXOSC|nr:myotrophin, putative [Ixodes scapularis]|eukprot:XP_002435089.1 myotrophin, putative [Ixodes scapularis]
MAPSSAGSSDRRTSKGTTNPVSKALEKRNKLGETMLQVAAIKGNADRVRQLLEEGADPNVKDHAGWTPLHEACNHGFREVARLLLSHGACVDVAGPGGVTPLHDATVNGHPDIVLLLVRSGATLDAKTSDGLTAQDLAQGEVMRAALCTAVPPKVVALRSGHEACNHGFREVARLLLSHGACVDVAGPGGVTPLHDATVNGHPDIVLLLVRSGATLDAK